MVTSVVIEVLWSLIYRARHSGVNFLVAGFLKASGWSMQPSIDAQIAAKYMLQLLQVSLSVMGVLKKESGWFLPLCVSIGKTVIYTPVSYAMEWWSLTSILLDWSRISHTWQALESPFFQSTFLTKTCMLHLDSRGNYTSVFVPHLTLSRGTNWTGVCPCDLSLVAQILRETLA